MSKENIEIMYVQPYKAGFYYYSPVDYQGGLQYAELEEEVSNYHLNNILNGLSPSMLINFNNLDGKIIDNKHYYPVKIFYEDTDAGGIVYHSNYLKFFERARTSLLNLLKIDQLNIKKQDDIILVVRKADITWNKPAKLNDTLLIETCLKYAKNSSITLEQKAFINNQNLNSVLVTGEFQIVAVDSNFKVRRIKNILQDMFFTNNK